ncbi:fibrocystin [Suncus etruscus]|uniref:fibrocystin n=1 Tax=Suncus etruscus TaxID=109475 RepID=UPI00210F52DB|nr:fibrocystin [Suncus etruscus]
MSVCLISMMDVQILLLTVSCLGFRIEPEEGSLAGGTWITVIFDGLESDLDLLYPANGSQLEINLVNVLKPALLSIPCDISPLFLDLPVLMCRTRSLPSEADEGLYYLEVHSQGQVVGNTYSGPQESCTFRFSRVQTPIIHQVNPSSGVPGELIHMYGRIMTGRLETIDLDDYIDSPLILEAQGDGWVTPCSYINRQTGSSYPIQEDHGLGTLQCHVEGNYIGSQNVSFSVYNKGKSLVHKTAWLISAKQDLFLYQTYSELLSVFPESGSLGGKSVITITGNFFDSPTQVTIAGLPCDISNVSPRKIVCSTRAPGSDVRLEAPQPGNRGLLFEVGDAEEDTNLTETTSGYKWQIVPNASSPAGFWSKEGQLFRARLSGFFVAPETNNYTFWIQADSPASLYFSLSEDPRTKVKVASIKEEIADWFDSWEQNGNEGTWQQKAPKLQLSHGARYYLEAEQYGRAPSRGMRIGVQIHNTWLNPDVVSTYLREKHQIRIHAQSLPEIQMLTVSGNGRFLLKWDNVSTQPIFANATAHQMQAALEELLAVKCQLEPLTVNILLRLGFEQGLDVSSSDGELTNRTEPFCGRFSLSHPQHIVLIPLAASPGYQLSQYSQLCMAYKGHIKNLLKVTLYFTAGVQSSIRKNITCDWHLTHSHPNRWQFTCTDLWRTCVLSSTSLQTPLANSPGLVHRIDLYPLAQKPGMFYVDEIIIADRNLTVFQADSGAGHAGGNLVESFSVEGSSPVYNVTFWSLGCSQELPLITASPVLTEGAEEGAGMIQVRTQRLQRKSPPLGGDFCIRLSNTVIPGVPAHISAHNLQKLLQNNVDDFTSRYLNASDFTVTEDRKSCYEHVWTLSWSTQVGDLPEFISVSDENLTGVDAAATTRVVYDGGVFLGPIFGDMLLTAHKHTQVLVRVNDIPAHCSGFCTFQYLERSTPQIYSVWYSPDGDTDLLVYITGTGFSEDSQSLQVTVYKAICKVIFSNLTNVVCQRSLLPVGLHQILMMVYPFGLAISANGGDVFLNVEPKVTAVEPARASEIGGIWAIIRGFNLEDVGLVLFGSQSCAINSTTSNLQRIQCKIPPRKKDNTVNVTVMMKDYSAVLPMAFTYVSSLNPVIISLSRNRSSIAGGESLFIGMMFLPNCSDLNVEVLIQDTPAQIHALTAEGLEVALPPLPAGLHKISVSINGINICSQGIDLLIHYITEVFSIEPCCGSLLGGTILSISGEGFGRDPTLVQVLVGNRSCALVTSTDQGIWCETPPTPTLPDLGAVAFAYAVDVCFSLRPLAHGSSFLCLVGKSFTFTYKVAATPVVTALWDVIVNNSLEISVAGHNLSDSVLLLGHLACRLETRDFGNDKSGWACSFPLDNLEAGIYPLQVQQKQLGFANMSAVSPKFLVTPQIKVISPTHGSVCGGTVLTVRGWALHSTRGSIQVSFSGPFTCVVLSWGRQTILCQIKPEGNPLPGVSYALNITVLVDGLASRCLGTCTVLLSEESTSIVEAFVAQAQGALTSLLIWGVRLGSTAGELVVLVDTHLPCTVTFWNGSYMACWISDLAPGQHHLSVLGTRNGDACFGNISRDFHVGPQVFHYFPKNVSKHGGSMLTMEGTALKGWNSTSVFVGQQTCLTVNISSVFIRCVLPAGNGPQALSLEVDGISYQMGVIGYSHNFTPELLSISQKKDVLTFEVTRISGAANMDIFIGSSPCLGISGNYSVLQCLAPALPAGDYPVRSYDHRRGWASSVLLFTSRIAVTTVTDNFGSLEGSLVHVTGAGFSRENISATVCGAPCQILANMTVSAFSCLVLPLDASLAFLCGLKHGEEDCENSTHTYVRCDLTIAWGTNPLPESWSYLYICEGSSLSFFATAHWTAPVLPMFSGLFISPKVERDEVLIYNSSCNITMETEAKIECETPNQPITAKITEIQRSWGQNTQGKFSFQFCRRWSNTHSWFPERVPQDGDNVTVENGHSLLLDTNTSILGFVHVKGGKLVFMGPGPIELKAHSILVSDGGELRIGSADKPFQGKAQITLHGSSHSIHFFPYGVKFLAVKNGTLSLHGLLPEKIVTHLRTAAYAHDTILALEDAVDWNRGDEAVIISGVGVEGTKPMEEVVIVETVHGSDLHLRAPLRYSHNFLEQWVAGEHHILKVTVALLSRSITIRGNITNERTKFLDACQEISALEGNLHNCLYFKSEKILGSRDLGAKVIIQSFPEEPSHVQVKGVQFLDLGQAFHKHLSSLTLVGALRDSYIQGSTLWGSFSRGLSLPRTWGLRVDNNIFYNILGNAIMLGTYIEMRSISWEAISGNKNEEGNIIRNNVIISLLGTEGLSSPEMLTPSGIYIYNPTNIVEGNKVCNAGYGFFFHLVTSETSQAPLTSFTQNIAHSCTRYGLFVYPTYEPPWDHSTSPTVFHNFRVWGSAGGVQVFRSKNIHLKNFQVYACREFGIDILESDANTSITDSLLLGHFTQKRNVCMSAGIKTPKRQELIVSNTTFVNFDIMDCVAIRTCSGCSQGQGGFTVTTSQLNIMNSSNIVAFPFPHAAILEDLDGSLSGRNRSYVLASMETLTTSCVIDARFSQIVQGSVCREEVLFHRMSIGLANAPSVTYGLTLTDSRNKTISVNYVNDTLSNHYGWMALLLDQETYLLQFESPCTDGSLQYFATFDNFAPGNFLLLVHPIPWPDADILLKCGNRSGWCLPSLPSPGQDQECDWFFNHQLRQLTYLVSGEGQVQVFLQVKEGIPSTTSTSTSTAESALKWSLPEAWTGVEKGWGGYNHTVPGPGDDVLILPNRTILVNTELPVLNGLYVMGTLEFPVDRSNTLSVACLVIAGGELKIGTVENPLEKEQKLLIHLRASEGIVCNRFSGIHIEAGTIGVYGKLQLSSTYTKKPWTRLGTDIASGNERIILEDTVDWRPFDKIVLSSSSYEPHEAEVLNVKEVKGRTIWLHERLKHRHIGNVHVLEDGRAIRLAAEVGLLTRNIQIQPDLPCKGRILVGSFRKSSGEQFSGVLQLLNVEMKNLGSPSYSAIEITNVSAGSWVISSTMHQNCGGGIYAAASEGILFNDNVVFGTVGHGIDLEGQTYSLSNNLVILTTQSAWSTIWVAGIKVNLAQNITLRGNVVAGSERLGFHIRGHRCFPSHAIWSDNVAHSSLHGLHLYKESGLDNCTRISGFLAFKNFDYGAMLYVENSMEIENITLVDNAIGLWAVVYVSQSFTENVQIVLRNSIIVATSSSFDCILDRIKPYSENLTSTYRAPSNPRGGRVGILWPEFLSVPNQWPQDPWHKVRSAHSISGIMKLQDVTFSNFVKSCSSDDLDICIQPNVENTRLVHPIIAERTSMLNIPDKNKFYFPASQSRKNLEMLVCRESDCENPGKYLFKDLDGKTLGLPPPVSVFPKTEVEWTGSFFNTGTFREEQKCTYRYEMNGYVCKQTDQVILILDSTDVSWEVQKFYPVVSVTDGFVDTFSNANTNTSCSSAGFLSTLYSILPTRKITKVCFVDRTPQILRFFLLGNKNNTKLLLAIFYHTLQSPQIFFHENFISPSPVQPISSLLSGPVGANYFDLMENLLYVVLQGEEPIEVRSGVSIHLALAVLTSALEKDPEIPILKRLTDFLQVSQFQVRLIHEMPGNKATLKSIADSKAKRKRNCPTVMCSSYYRISQRRPLMDMNPYRASQPNIMESRSKVIIIEISDLPTVRKTGPISSLSIDKLQMFSQRIITAQQTGMLENFLNVTIEALLITQSKVVMDNGNLSSFHTENLIYVRPYALSVLIQPSDGEVGKELPVQPQLIFLDKQNHVVESLGPPSKPWVISVSLEGTSDSVLRGCTQAETQDGYVSFSGLAVLISGSNWHFIFTVTSPPEANFTVKSKPFAVSPVIKTEKTTVILAITLCSVFSWLALCCLVCCWLKRNKSRKIKNEEVSETQTNDQKNHASSKGSQVDTEKEDTTMTEDMRMMVMSGQLNQVSQQSLNGVSRRKVRRPAGRKEDGKQIAASLSAPSIASIPSHAHTRAPSYPEQQVNLKETGTWRKAQEQLLRYQLAGQDQKLLLHPDLRPDVPQFQEQGQLGEKSGNLEISQKKPAVSATKAFCLNSAVQETLQNNCDQEAI